MQIIFLNNPLTKWKIISLQFNQHPVECLIEIRVPDKIVRL